MCRYFASAASHTLACRFLSSESFFGCPALRFKESIDRRIYRENFASGLTTQSRALRSDSRSTKRKAPR
jgi:hypothetical protein